MPIEVWTEYKDLPKADGVSFRHMVAGGVFTRMMIFDKDATIAGHNHTYDHASIVVKGVVIVEVDGEKREVRAPAIFATEKGKIHKFTALEDDTQVLCVHTIEQRVTQHSVE